jgi:hypothetical protein
MGPPAEEMLVGERLDQLARLGETTAALDDPAGTLVGADLIAVPDPLGDLPAGTTLSDLLRGLAGAAIRSEWWDADTMINPSGSDWAVNTTALLAIDTNDNELVVRLFDPTSEEGAGMRSFAAAGASRLRVILKARAETTPGGQVTAKWLLYAHSIVANNKIWGDPVQLTDTVFEADELWVQVTTTIDFPTLDLVAGQPCILEITRDATHVGDDWTGDVAVLGIGLEWL